MVFLSSVHTNNADIFCVCRSCTSLEVNVIALMCLLKRQISYTIWERHTEMLSISCIHLLAVVCNSEFSVIVIYKYTFIPFLQAPQILRLVSPVSSSAKSSHLTLGLPTCQVPSALCRVNFLQGLCFCILKRCCSNFNHSTVIIFTISG